MIMLRSVFSTAPVYGVAVHELAGRRDVVPDQRDAAACGRKKAPDDQVASVRPPQVGQPGSAEVGADDQQVDRQPLRAEQPGERQEHGADRREPEQPPFESRLVAVPQAIRQAAMRERRRHLGPVGLAEHRAVDECRASVPSALPRRATRSGTQPPARTDPSRAGGHWRGRWRPVGRTRCRSPRTVWQPVPGRRSRRVRTAPAAPTATSRPRGRSRSPGAGQQLDAVLGVPRRLVDDGWSTRRSPGTVPWTAAVARTACAARRRPG